MTNNFQQNLKTAKRGFRTKLWFGLLGGILLFVVLPPLVFFTHSVSFQVAPPLAAENVSVSVSDGAGVVWSDAAYVLGGRAALRFAARGFISRTLEVDFATGAKHLVVELKEAPVRVVITTAPSLAETRWHINGVYAATAGRFDRALQPGAVRVEVDNEFYLPETLQLEVQTGQDLTRHLDLTPLAGDIDIRSEPAGALVVINGAQKGPTPVQLAAVPGGVHRVRVMLEGYQTVEEEIVITNTRSTIKRDYRLALKQTAVRVKASPAGGVLRVNGVAADIARLLSLAAGRKHVLRYEKPGYLPQSREVLLKANEQVEISFALEKEIGEVVVRSTPPADLRVNGVAMGVTPQTLRLQALPQKITLARSGYRTVEVPVTPSAAAPLLIDEKLQTELAARLSEARAVLTAAAGVSMKFFDPRAQSGAGSFTMGAPRNEKARRANEFQRRVMLSKPFYVSATEITEEQFAQYKPLQGAGKKHPVRNVSWAEAAGFCNWMSKQDGLQPAYDFAGEQLRGFDATADGYRLLSEAEWEWLARVAGRPKASRFVWGDDTTIPANSGNFADESAKGSVAKYIPRYDDGFAGVAPVASFVADAAGLYDMAGNVSEWVHDLYDLRPPEPGRVESNPFGGRHGDGAGDGRVVKGASFRSASITGLRSSFREGLPRARDDVGFRVARYLYGKE